MKKYRKGEIAAVILKTILAVGFVAVALSAPNAVQLFKYFNPRTARERERIKQSFMKLERGGYIKRRDALDGYFTLTQKGKSRAMRYEIEKTKIPRPKKWDDRWRLVMFDVPEKEKRARQAINFALKKIGCVHYQKSVFITPFPCEHEVNFVARCFGVRKYIRIVIADRIEGDTALKTKFNL